MIYENVMQAVFLSRPNRFLARVLLNGNEAVCHVKNTGRLGELLIPGVPAAVQFHPDAMAQGRKTEYSLIAVKKEAAQGPQWVNIDSQAPNQTAWEWLTAGEGLPFCPRPDHVKREVRYGDSRFDLAFSCGGSPWVMEVKGVTLDMDGTAMFPDAPTERGIRHLEGLMQAVKDGYGAAALFVIQMKGVHAFSPHRERHPEFAAALKKAKENGVRIWAYDCAVTDRSMKLDAPVPVIL